MIYIRPKKYIKSRQLTITLDDQDISWLDDHRGKLTRGDYLVESMYALKSETSNHLKDVIDKYQKLSVEVHDLKKQIMFNQSTNNKQTKSIITILADEELNTWYNERDIQKSMIKMNGKLNWRSMFIRNIDFLSKKVKDHKELERFCIEKFKNNGSIKG